MSDEVTRTDQQWRAELEPDAYHVLRQRGTERPFTGRYYAHDARGLYRCAGCGNALFDSGTKYDSGSGWPSFWQPVDPERVALQTDTSLGVRRTELLCVRCGGHLGHVFDDGPLPTGRRYCVNSAALDFEASD